MGAELSAKHEALLECPCLVELSEKLNPFKQDRVRIYAQSYGDNIKKFAALNLPQYENDSNPRAYEKWLAPRIWKQTDGKLTIACAGLGTTGTAMGMSRYFKRVSQNCVVVGAMCAPGAAVPGLRGEDRLRE